MSPEFEAAYLRQVALSFEKQLVLSDVVGNRNWSFSMDSGKLTFAKQGLFGQPLMFDAQLLGSAAQDSSSWLWSWANESVPKELSAVSLILREKGELPEFSTPEFPINFDEADEHRIAMASSGVLAELFGCDAYYRGPYEGGAAFFLLRDPRLQLAPPNAVHIATVFPQLISNLSISNHRAAFLAYMEKRGLVVQEEGNTMRVEIAASSAVASFDQRNRLADIQVTARPPKTS
jgi:hypothetical protein